MPNTKNTGGTLERLELLDQIEQAVAASQANAQIDAHAALGRAVAPHLPCLRDMLSTGVHGEPIRFEAVSTPAEAVRFSLRLSHLQADAWRLDWTTADGETSHALHTSLLEALIAAEALSVAVPAAPAWLTPLFADRANAMVGNLLTAAREVAGLLPPRDDSPEAAVARLREAAQAFAPLSIINPCS